MYDRCGVRIEEDPPPQKKTFWFSKKIKKSRMQPPHTRDGTRWAQDGIPYCSDVLWVRPSRKPPEVWKNQDFFVLFYFISFYFIFVLIFVSNPPRFILNKKIGVGQPKVVENAKILIANTAMDTDKIKIYGSRVRVDSMNKARDL